MRAGRGVLFALCAFGLLAACAPPAATSSVYYVNPSTTEAGIASDSVFTHVAGYPTTTPRGELAVVLHGSGASPLAYLKLTGALQAKGFHVANLRYLGGVGTGSACPNSNALADPDCHRAFRAETVFGENVDDGTGHSYDSPAVSIDNKNSVMNRLLELVDYMKTTYPAQGWGQFAPLSGGSCVMNTTYDACELDWSKVVVVGHSLGGGVGLYMSKVLDLHRVGLVSAPFDEYVDGSTITVAPWISEGGFATSTNDIFGLQHTGESNYAATAAAWTALGLGGPTQSVDGGVPPYGGSHQLTTSLTPGCLSDSSPKHNSTAQDGCTPGSPPTLTTAWGFLATG